MSDDKRTYQSSISEVFEWARKCCTTNPLRRAIAPFVWLVAWLWLIALVILVSGSVVAAYSSKQLEVTRRKSAVRRAESARARAIALEQAILTKAEKSYRERCVAAKSQLQYLEDANGRQIARYRGVVLYERAILFKKSASRIVGVHAAVQATGGVSLYKKGTLTRVVTGGVVLGPIGALAGGTLFKKKKSVDTREVYLTIDTEDFTESISCPGADQGGAQRFAAKVNTAAKQAVKLEQDRPAAVNRARRALADIEADQSEIATAQSGVANAKSNVALLDAVATTRSQLADIRPQNRKGVKSSAEGRPL